MTLPWRGRVRGTITTARSPSASAASPRTFSSSSRPPMVSLATTRIVFTGLPPRGGRSCRRGFAAGGGARARGDRRRRRAEDAVHRARHAVLVGAADDGGDGVEVEDRRRRGDLPLE